MVLQMLGLVVNSYIDANDEEDFKHHRMKASLMDLADMSVPRANFNLPADEGMNVVDSDDDEPMPSVDLDAIVQSLDVTPLMILTPTTNLPEPQGTPGGYTGSSTRTTQDVLPARTSGADPFGTRGGCSTSVSPRPVMIPKAETLDIPEDEEDSVCGAATGGHHQGLRRGRGGHGHHGGAGGRVRQGQEGQRGAVVRC